MLVRLCRRLFGGTTTPLPVLPMQPVAAVAPRPEPRREPVRTGSAAPRRRARATPRRSRRRPEPVTISAAALARRLLQSCQLAYSPGEDVLHEDVEVIYEGLCALEGLQPLPWRDVGAELRQLTGGRKTYKWIVRDGQRHRLRVYRMPEVEIVELRGAA